jgi:hypothetical protein
MGLLDDAIREHLELKRQRGGDPADVARLEREALGPVVRGSELGEPAVEEDFDHFPSEEAVPQAEAADEHEPEHEYYEDEPPPRELPAHVGQPTEEFDVEGVEHADEVDPAHEVEPAHVAEPEPERQPHRDSPPQPRPAAGPATGEHDVLQDTPEFLQETPEHDRLWFEQAPPQEFDFDK